jgi:hypothetical protein
MSQVFQRYIASDIDIAKVDQNVEHVAMTIHIFFKCLRCMFQVFLLDAAKVDLNVAYTFMLQSYVSSDSYIYCKCFIWMLHMFYNGYTCVFKYF